MSHLLLKGNGQFHRKCYNRVKKMKLTNKGYFPLKINKEVLTFDDEEKERRK